jgi:hypothetical protein
MKASLSLTLLYLLLPLSQSLPLSSSGLSGRSAQEGKGEKADKAEPIPLLEIGDLTPFGIELPDTSGVSISYASMTVCSITNSASDIWTTRDNHIDRQALH